MATSRLTINTEYIKVFPSVRANTRNTRSFTEQNIASLISRLFINMNESETVDGFSVCEHDVSGDTWVLFNLGGRFFDVQKYSIPGSASTVYVGVELDAESKELNTYITDNEYGDMYFSTTPITYPNFLSFKLYEDGNLANRIHLYVGDSDNDNAYQTKAQIRETYATKTEINNIETIDGGTIPSN